MDDFKNIIDIKAEEKKLYEEYKAKVAELKKVQKEKEAVGQVFTKGLLPIYVLFILHLNPSKYWRNLSTFKKAWEGRIGNRQVGWS